MLGLGWIAVALLLPPLALLLVGLEATLKAWLLGQARPSPLAPLRRVGHTLRGQRLRPEAAGLMDIAPPALALALTLLATIALLPGTAGTDPLTAVGLLAMAWLVETRPAESRGAFALLLAAAVASWPASGAAVPMQVAAALIAIATLRPAAITAPLAAGGDLALLETALALRRLAHAGVAAALLRPALPAGVAWDAAWGAVIPLLILAGAVAEVMVPPATPARRRQAQLAGIALAALAALLALAEAGS